MKIWGGSRARRANILNSRIVFCLHSTCPFGPLVPTRNAFAAVLRLKEAISEAIRKFSDKYIVPDVRLWTCAVECVLYIRVLEDSETCAVDSFISGICL